MKRILIPDANPDFEELLSYLKRTRGFDFSGYKRPSLTRRVQKRMDMLNLETYADYLDYLEVHPEEFTHLFNMILINVTGFFRDPSAWEYIQQEVVPAILKHKKLDEPIRVWSAGCASGEEAYTIAMILAEIIGPEAFRERVKIYASDADELALNQARQSSYTEREIANVPADLLEKYFEKTGNRYQFRKDLRRNVIFGRLDLVQDSPISRLDLLICRNTLMYFNAETQARILARFHFALNETGYLFLGKAEMLFTHGNLFLPVEIKRRVFAKVPLPSLRERFIAMTHTDDEQVSTHLTRHIRLRESAFDAHPTAQLVVDVNGELVMINEKARNLLNLSSADVNRPLRSLEMAYWTAELRERVEEVFLERRLALIKNIDIPGTGSEIRTLEVQIAPLKDPENNILGVNITLMDMTSQRRLQEEVEHANQELETAYEELQSTNEELETTNEELQSTIEELETTNEELQSTNEELETINEEMQSTNEEIQTVNEELRRRTEELNQVNTFLESILASLRGGVIVVDQDLRVLVWSRRAEDSWGLRAHEVQGKNFLYLDIGLPVEQLKQPIRACLVGEADIQELSLNAINRRGKSIRCKVTCTPLLNTTIHMPAPDTKDVRGVILLTEEVEVHAGNGA